MSQRRFPTCIMATAVVPWTDRDTLDEAKFQQEIAALVEERAWLVSEAGGRTCTSSVQPGKAMRWTMLGLSR